MSRYVLILVLYVCASVGVLAQGAADAEIQQVNSELSKAYSSGSFDEALVAAEKLVKLSVAKFGKDDVSTARALKNRGFVEAARGDVKSAENSLEDAAGIFRKQRTLSNADSRSFAETLETLAGLRMKRDLLFGEKLLIESIELRERAGMPDPKLAYALASLANINFWKREYDTSAAHYKRSLDIFTAAKATDSSDFTNSYYRARCAFRKAKKETEFEALKAEHGYSADFFGGRPASGKAKLINGGVVNGKALHLAKPAYPVEARRAYAEGTVEVDVLIGEDGSIISACTSNSPHPALAEASEISAYNSKFSPTTLQGNPVKVSGRITYKFSR